MQRIKRVLLILALLLPGINLTSEELVLDIDKAVEIAIRNNLNVRASRIEVKTRERAKDAAWNEFLPSLTGSISLGRHNDAPSVTGPLAINPLDPTAEPVVGDVYDYVLWAEKESSPWNLSPAVKTQLTLSTAILSSIRKTRLGYEAALISRETAVKQLERDVRKAYYNLLLLRANIELFEQNIKTAQKRYNQARTNYANGLASELTMLNAQVTLENMGPQLVNLKTNYQAYLMSFSFMLGIHREVEPLLTGEIEVSPQELDSEQLCARYLENRLDIRELKKSLELLENRKRLFLDINYTPSLTFSFSWNPVLNDPFTKESWENWDNWQDQGLFGIQLNMSLDGFLPYSKTDLKAREFDDSIEKTKLALEAAYQAALVDVETLVLKLEKSAITIKSLNFNVRLSEKAYTLTEAAYNAGTMELLEVEKAANERQKAKLEVLKEKYHYLTGLLDLEYALNTSL